jgi:hypothetical protein
VDSTWTKDLVQAHARAAVSVELYTLPLYLTAMSSIKSDPAHPDPIRLAIFSIAMEEMLHLQLAANLCVALDTTPQFTAPAYKTAIPFLDPTDPNTGHNALINAVLGPFDQTRLDTMLAIEAPEELEDRSKDHTTPDFPYQSIGEMYDALLVGIVQVGEGQFGWKTDRQIGDNSNNGLFDTQKYSLVLASLADAQTAVKVINEQGEGKAMDPVPTPPYKEDQFPVEADFVLANAPHDPATLSKFSHFGRFIDIRDKVAAGGWPPTVTGASAPTTDAAQSALNALKAHFASLISDLNTLWTAGAGGLPGMFKLLGDLHACWKADVIPQWS